MAKAQIDVNHEILEKLRPIALKNNKGTSVQNLINLSLEIAISALELDNDSFKLVTKLEC